MTDTKELERIIEESGLKKSYIAKALNLSRAGLWSKINNKSDFNTTEIEILCRILKITKLTDRHRIFFSGCVI